MNRTKLKKDPDASRKRQAEQLRRTQAAETAAEENPGRGQVRCASLRMMQTAPHVEGYLSIFPNRKHRKRVDGGLACSYLSPMELGPVPHQEPGQPQAKNIENYHQAAKFFEGLDQAGPGFWQDVGRRYADPVPHRHKHAGHRQNAPLYSVRKDTSGRERRFNYLESRYFYCYWYAQLAPAHADYRRLTEALDRGFNLLIVGYDGYEVTRSLREHYEDVSRPFGHELVLYTLLTVANPADYPWAQYRREHTALYEGFGFL